MIDCAVDWVQRYMPTKSWRNWFLGVRSDRGVCLDFRQERLPLGTHGGIADAVEKEYEQTLEVDADHEHRL